MPYSVFRSDRFKKEYKKLDGRQQQLVKKKIDKIVENPEVGKPLHAPLQNFKSERIENLRIVYTIEGTLIKFAWIEDRGHAYD
ncbi:MAG: type II toxin-antitoxin system RelE/ParE family toxin [Candidatus Diapherotrites archaeon]|uniref:Type II toxin-antitoxin system RelE/ParE family toxin n=1 Tax=Candidatus Iainarchaeum sp. TaxID=3101447 RepID=A0A8T4L5Q9_9ARCH|nr:type II toxin-antitoxin system RelE/ParE family toxin [Candidatus Diapherotrites archaeon]